MSPAQTGRYLLDTNAASAILRQREPVCARAASVPLSSLAISSVTAGEMHYGLAKRPQATALAKLVREFLPEGDLIAYTEAILRVYNLYGRRDNKYKARIKILVHETGIDELRRDIEKEFERIRDGVLHLPKADIDAINSWFARPAYRDLPAASPALEAARKADRHFDRWVKNNVTEHVHPGHAIVTVSLKPAGARRSVAPRSTTRKKNVSTTSATKPATSE